MVMLRDMVAARIIFTNQFRGSISQIKGCGIAHAAVENNNQCI
jgi:hypothetical protein